MTKTIKTLFYIIIWILFLENSLFAQAQSISDIAELASQSVVQIVVYDITGTKIGQGSGFFIAPGKILTNAHVIKKAYSAEILSDNEYYGQIIVLKSDVDIDLALIKVDIREEKFLQLEKKKGIRPGLRVIAIGNPLGLEKTLSDGLVSAIRGIPELLQLIQISAPISPGSSGGPLLTQEGKVIGVTTSTLRGGQNLNFAIGFETIDNFLRKQDNPKQLNRAKSRVLWRVILKWIVTVILGIIGVLFSDRGGPFGWLPVAILFGVIALVAFIFSSLYRLIAAFYKKIRKKDDKKRKIDQLSQYQEDLLEDNEIENKETDTINKILEDDDDDNSANEDTEDLFEETKTKDTDKDKVDTFHCWKCGEKIFVYEKTNFVECEECGTSLSVPEL